MEEKDIESWLKFWIDKGSHRDNVLSKMAQNTSYSKERCEQVLDKLISKNQIISDRNGILIIVEFMPYTAERIKKNLTTYVS